MLTPKQKRFCQEYIIDLNATQAAIRAGYSERTAKAIGCENLTKPDVQEQIEKLQKKVSDKLGITAEMVAAELAKIGFTDMAQYAEWGDHGITLKESSELSPQLTAAVSELSCTITTRKDKDDTTIEHVNLKFKLHDKKGALELLGRHLGMFKDNVNLTGQVEGVIRLPGLVPEGAPVPELES